jgi:hypothetical protein
MARVKKSPKCSICHQIPQPSCNWQQGRCPHLPPVLQLTIIDKLLNFFKGKHDQSSRSSKTQKHKSSKKRT